MILNRIEFLAMNNPIRAAVQRFFEGPRLQRTGGEGRDAGKALEIGCGRGVGIEIILDRFNAETVDAFDLDPRMVERAHKRLSGRKGVGRIWVGDATQISAPGATYDSAFDFGIIHHIPDWRKALSEAFRVLKPGGRFYVEEVLKSFVAHPLWKRLLGHPQENRFDHDDFRSALEEAGFVVLGSNKLWNSFGWFVSEKRK